MNKMTTFLLKISLLTLSILSFPLPANSANMAFLEDTAGQYFNQDDWNLFASSTQHALNTLANGKNESWRNPKTGSSGVLKPINSMKKNGTICRDLQITNRAKGWTDQYVFTYCKYRTGWKILPQGA